MKFDIYGKKVLEVVRCDGVWLTFYLGNAGVKRVADDIHIPPEVEEGELESYIDDLFHEYATRADQQVRRL